MDKFGKSLTSTRLDGFQKDCVRNQFCSGRFLSYVCAVPAWCSLDKLDLASC